MAARALGEDSGRRARWGCGLAVVATLTPALMLAAWIALRSAGPTEPLWTASDVPPAPARADNGWVVIDEEMSRTPFDDAAKERLDELLEPDTALDVRITGFDRASATLHTESLRHAAVIATVERALARPRFADACPLDIQVPCPALELLDVQLLVALRSFALASEGRLVDALALSTSALRASLDLGATARRITSMAVATIVIGRTLALIEDLVGLARRTEVPPASWAATRSELRRLLGQRARFDRRRTVRCEYIAVRRELDYLLASSRGRTSAFMIDARATSSALDDHYSAWDAYARDPSRPAPTVPSEPNDVTPWWVYNPLGDLLLYSAANDYRARLDHIRRTEDELDAHAQTMLSALPDDP